MSEDDYRKTNKSGPSYKELQNEEASVPAKRKAPGLSTVISQATLSKPDWAYVHLRLINTTTDLVKTPNIKVSLPPVDQLTVYMHIQSALRSFLGLHGIAIAYDILRTESQDIWIRVHREDAETFIAAVGGWAGKSEEAIRIVTWGYWGPTERNNGMDLFND